MSSIFALFLLITFLSVCHLNFGFNLSPLPNLVIRKPNLQTFKPQNRSSYFGFTLVLREKSLIIGAPRAQSTLYTQAAIDEAGDIYKCPLNLRHTTAESPEAECKPFVFERSGNVFDPKQQSRNEFRDYQWLGAAMDGGSNDSEPLLACAPRFDSGVRGYADEVGYVHGICYRSANTLEESAVNVWRLKPFLRADLQINRGFYWYQMGQLGISAHITPNNNELIMGAPGFLNWQGTAVRFRDGFGFDIPNSFSHRTLLLNGYAVGSGYLDDLYRNSLVFVTTAPHENKYYGKAFVYRYSNMQNGVHVLTELTGDQYAEYYGYALLVSDINGDGLDDILITAPQHRVNGEADIGAIYVYINKRRFKFSQQLIEAPFKSTARFGTTITSLGDINNDGYNDIAIGAPLYNGVGAVVIYHGGPDGLQPEPRQILMLPENLEAPNNYFGHGLSKGVDIDGNGYADLAIGAPNGEVVYVYRAYPVVKVTATLKATEASIKPETNFVDFKVCFQLDSERFTALKLELQADSRLRRLKFQDNNSHQLSQTVLATNFQKCQDFRVDVVFVANQMFTPLEMELRYSLVNNGTQQTKQDFCNNCAVMDPSVSRTHRSVVKYNPGCKSDVCTVDLSIESKEMPTKIIIGEMKALKIVYNILNRGEKAFNTQVTLTNSLNLTLTRMPPQCFELIENELICDIAKGINALEKSAQLEIEFDLGNVTTVNELFINAIITSTGNELDNQNNKVTNKIQFERNSTANIVGVPMDSFLSFGKYDKTLVADFVYQLDNYGPSAIKDFVLIVQMPIAFLDDTQQPVQYINVSDIEYLMNYGTQQISGAEFKSSAYQMQENSQNLTEIWQSLESIGIHKNRTRLQTCQGLNTTLLCATSFLPVDLLQNKEHLTLQLRINFDVEVVRDFLGGEQNFMGFYVDVAAELNSTFKSALSLTKTIKPVVIEYRAVPERPIWIYLLAIVGGVLLFALLTFGLLKVGFFKRAKKEEMLKILEASNKPATVAPTAPLEN